MSRELPVILAECEAAQRARIPWWQVARTVARVGSAEALLTEPWEPADRWEYDVARALGTFLRADAQQHWSAALDEWTTAMPELRFVTILDDAYPVNLRRVFNPPPFLVWRGDDDGQDVRAVAVVGTRSPSSEGLARARRLGGGLAAEGVTVLSGLAKGIDAAAHAGALEAGGRTVAVLGHGLLRPIYPAESRGLADEILAAGGALVSQFLPDTPPTRGTFPLRNVVMSGMAQGTVVVEAGKTSGARMQARFAAEQDKRVWLLQSLVDAFEWAAEFADRYRDRTRVVSDVSDVLDELHDAGDAPIELPPVADAEERRRGDDAHDELPLFA
jgi:DNA processing protein